MMSDDDNKVVVMFVDDEEKVLRGLESMLFDHDDRWEMKFVNFPEEALEKMSEEQVSILVTDIQMPEMNGVELMKKVREQYPSVYCIALTGEAKKENLQSILDLADKLLDKPCTEKILVGTLSQAEEKLQD